MSRSLKDCNEQLFKSIRERGTNIVDDGNARYININNTNGRDFFLKSKLISSIKPTLDLDFAVFIHNNVLYFVFVGYDNPIFYNDGLTIVPVNEGVYIAVLTELNISLLKNISDSDIKDYYEYYDSNYSGHDFDGIKNLFPPVQVYEVCLSDNNYDGFLNRIAIDYFCSNENSTILPFSHATTDLYILLSNSHIDLLPLDNILRSITASSWRYCFLDLYRCIENLYEIGKVFGFYGSFENEFDFKTFHDKLKSGPDIKGYEISSLENLFTVMSTYYNSILDPIKASPNEKNSNFIYKLRNSVVHHRNDTISINYEDSEWEKIIVFLLYSIDTIYARFQDVIK